MLHRVESAMYWMNDEVRPYGQPASCVTIVQSSSMHQRLIQQYPVQINPFRKCVVSLLCRRDSDAAKHYSVYVSLIYESAVLHKYLSKG